ncbi:MAG: hypothetical protein HYY01_08285 [Chloroflexi bacterium]|nr:hypothetical protein [Chloroflexota bacterium]
MAERTIIVLDPTAVGHPVEKPLSPRPESLEGKRVGFLWNGKPNADVFLAELQRLVSERCRPAASARVNWSKTSASGAAFEGLLEELAANCDAVVNGVGD